ncbi:MAG: hypothetical protein ACKO4M_00375, partial [Betaproteobacteria bacterium]
MSQPPVNTAQLSPTPNYSTSIPVVEVSDQPAIPAHQPAPYPPLMVANPLASQPQWLNDWSVAGQAEADHSSFSSSSTSSSQGSSSGVVLVSRQTTGPSPSALCQESLPPEALWSIFTQLQQPQLFNTSLSNLAK